MLLDVPSAWEVSPSACRWLYAHAGGLIEVRVTAPTTRHAIELEIAILEGPPARFLLSNHVALNGDDGAEAVPVRFKRDATGIALRPIPDTDVGRRFPTVFASIRRPAPPSKRWAGTRCCSPTAVTPAAAGDGGHRPGDPRWISFHRRLVAAPATAPASATTEAAATGSGRRWPGRSR